MGNELSTNLTIDDSQTDDPESDHAGRHVNALTSLSYEYINDPRFNIIRKTIKDLSAEKNELSERVRELEQKNETLTARHESVETNNNIDIINLHNEYNTKIKNLCDTVIASRKKNVNLQSDLNSAESTMHAMNEEVLQLKNEILDKNNLIKKVNDELVIEKEWLKNSKDTEAEMKEFERKNVTMKQEIEKLNGLVSRQRKNITETQNSSKSKSEKIKMLSSEKNTLSEQVRWLEEKNAALNREKTELESENRRLKEIVDDVTAQVVAQPSPKIRTELECNICLDECVEDCLVFAPCGHYACGNCAHQLTNCQTCRIRITSKIKLFL